ncbi:Importin beta family like protein [Aduncisulcus paluster]|uniref:Importin beta family like protein n=1 Tax=Aduncisulcus paluster TaxID=2918883 RepID=A0ABQ5K036_9EUKA|nr:Importin beta family like protein [Aduncisulcus paluster]
MDKKELENLFYVLNHPEHADHKEYSKKIRELSEKHKMKALEIFMAGLADISNPAERALCAVLFRRFVVAYQGCDFVKTNKNPELEKKITDSLIRIVENERDLIVQKRIAQLISYFVTMVHVGMSMEDNPRKYGWDIIIRKTIDWLDHSSTENISLTIFEEVGIALVNIVPTRQVPEYLRTIYDKFKTVLENSTHKSVPKLMCASLRCMMKLFTIAENKEPYVEVLRFTFGVIKQLLEKKAPGDYAQNLIKSLISLFESSNSSVIPHIKYIHANLKDLVANGDIPSNVRGYAFEAEVVLCEHLTTEVRKSIPNIARDLLPLAVIVFTEEIDDTPEDLELWASANGKDDFQETDVVNMIENAVDRLCNSLGGSLCGPAVLECLTAGLPSPIWKVRHAVLILFALSAEGIARAGASEKLIREFVVPTWKLMKDPHPRVRWAFANMVSRCAQDFYPTFIDKFSKDAIDALGFMSCEDSCGRVRAKAISCVTDIIDKGGVEIVEEHFDKIMEAIRNVLRVDRMDCRANGVMLLARVSEYGEHKIQSEYGALINPILEMLDNVTTEVEKSIKDELINENIAHSAFRSNLIECAATMCQAVGKRESKKDIITLFNLLIRSMKITIRTTDDTVLQSTMLAMSHVVRLIEEDVIPALPQIVEYALKIASVGDEFVTSGEDAMEDGDFEPNNTAADERAAAMSLLCVVISVVSGSFAVYLPKAIPVVADGLNSIISEEVKIYSANILGDVIECAEDGVSMGVINKSQRNEIISKIIKECVPSIMNNIVMENSEEVVGAYIVSLARIVEGVKEYGDVVKSLWEEKEKLILNPLATIVMNIPDYVESRIFMELHVDEGEMMVEYEDSDGEPVNGILVQSEKVSELLQKDEILALTDTDTIPEHLLVGLEPYEREELVDIIAKLRIKVSVLTTVLTNFTRYVRACIRVFKVPFIGMFIEQFSDIMKKWNSGNSLPPEKTAYLAIATDCIDFLHGQHEIVEKFAVIIAECGPGFLERGFTDLRRNAFFSLGLLAQFYPAIATKSGILPSVVKMCVEAITVSDCYSIELAKVTDNALTCLVRIAKFVEGSEELLSKSEAACGAGLGTVKAVWREALKRLEETRGDATETHWLVSIIIKEANEGNEGIVGDSGNESERKQLLIYLTKSLLKMFFLRERAEARGDVEGSLVLDGSAEKLAASFLKKMSAAASIFDEAVSVLSDKQKEEFKDRIGKLGV